MEKVLSQAEVDALLRGLSDGQIEAEQDKPSDHLILYAQW